MRMTAEPQGILTRRYTVMVAGAPETEISFPALGPSTATPIAGVLYRMRRVGVLREQFTLTCDDGGTHIIASATQRDPMRRDFTVSMGRRTLNLRARSLLSSDYLLFDGKRATGELRLAGPLRRGAQATLPDDLPLEACVFVLWVVLSLWRGRRVTWANVAH
ncbi:MAG TPA: hypothetical protein VE338_17265 [Ktedonobacterales bacterium]|jgi:hypothetical protein|nr:hypothetical protein [Ktedonobacterales bacterium]